MESDVPLPRDGIPPVKKVYQVDHLVEKVDHVEVVVNE